MNQVHLQGCPLVPWRNGGGRTRELLAWPGASDWRVRVSIAEIERDGPFSSFAGIDRCFAVLSGAGVILSLPQGDVRLTANDHAVSFAGEAAPVCRLIDGPTRDLNLMLRRGAGQASMRRRGAGQASMRRRPPGASKHPWRGVYAGGTLWWSDDPLEPLPLVAGWHLCA